MFVWHVWHLFLIFLNNKLTVLWCLHSSHDSCLVYKWCVVILMMMYLLYQLIFVRVFWGMYHTTLFKVPHIHLQSTTLLSLEYNITLFRVQNYSLQEGLFFTQSIWILGILHCSFVNLRTGMLQEGDLLFIPSLMFDKKLVVRKAAGRFVYEDCFINEEQCMLRWRWRYVTLKRMIWYL